MRHRVGLMTIIVMVAITLFGAVSPGAAIMTVPVSGVLILASWLTCRVAMPVALIVAWGFTAAAFMATVLIATYQALANPNGIDEQFAVWLWGLAAVPSAATAAGGVWYGVRCYRTDQRTAVPETESPESSLVMEEGAFTGRDNRGRRDLT